MPKVRDRSGSGFSFTCVLLHLYLKSARSVEELLSWLYHKGISTGDYQEALATLLGDNAKGLSSNTVSRRKEHWIKEHREWKQRNLSDRRYVYFGSMVFYSNVRLDDRLCLQGMVEHGRKGVYCR